MKMKTVIKVTVLPVMAAVVLLFYQNCGGGGGGSSSSASLNASSISCDEAGVTGTWVGSVNGNYDVLTATSSCALSSSYCASSSEFAIASINSGCPAGSTTCGEGVVRTSASNGNPDCFTTNTAANCEFSTVVSSSGTILYYTCGGNILTYYKQ